MNGPLVLKLGGELLESARDRDRIAAMASQASLITYICASTR